MSGASELTSRVSVRGQTAIPQALRRALGIRAGTRLSWSVHGELLMATVSPEDPITSTRGMLKGRTRGSDGLLELRSQERARERESELAG